MVHLAHERLHALCWAYPCCVRHKISLTAVSASMQMSSPNPCDTQTSRVELDFNSRRYLKACPCVHAQTSCSYTHPAPITLTAQDSLQVFSPLLHVHLHCVGQLYLIYGAVQQGCELHVERLQLCFPLAPQLPLGGYHITLACCRCVCCTNVQKFSELHDRISDWIQRKSKLGVPSRALVLSRPSVLEVSSCTILSATVCKAAVSLALLSSNKVLCDQWKLVSVCNTA